jgi:hypothetical protein
MELGELNCLLSEQGGDLSFLTDGGLLLVLQTKT